MDRVDMPFTKPLPYFWSFLSFWKTFHDHKWTKWKFTIFLGTPKTKKQEEDEIVQREKNIIFRPPYFQISYLLHFLFVLNNLKRYGSAIWSFTKPFWNVKTIEWCPKIINSKIQIGHMC
jgi:hypothetical protein